MKKKTDSYILKGMLPALAGVCAIILVTAPLACGLKALGTSAPVNPVMANGAGTVTSPTNFAQANNLMTNGSPVTGTVTNAAYAAQAGHSTNADVAASATAAAYAGQSGHATNADTATTATTATSAAGLNGQSLALLGTGLLWNTTGTGIPGIATASQIASVLGNSATGFQGVAQTALSAQIVASIGAFMLTPEFYGGVADGRQNDSISTTAGSTTITSSSGIFSANDAALDSNGNHHAIGIYDGVGVDVNATLTASTTITVSSATGLYVGMYVSGFQGSIALGTKVTGISGTTVTLNQATLLSGTYLVEFNPNMIVTTITGFTDSTHVTVAASTGLRTVSNVRIIWGTDNTLPIQSALTAGSVLGGGDVQLRLGIYVVAGALQNTSTFNSILEVPATNNQLLQMTIRGAGPSCRGFNTDYPAQDVPLTGTTIFGLTAGSGFMQGAVFSGNASQTSGATNSVNVRFQDLGIEVPVEGGCSGINFINAGGLMIDNISVTADIPKAIGGQQPATLNYGVVTPDFNSGGIVNLDHSDINEFGVGLQTDEHARGVGLQIAQCNTGLAPLGQTALWGVHIVSCVYDIQLQSGYIYLNLQDVLFEDNVATEYSVFFGSGAGAYGIIDSSQAAGNFTVNTNIPSNLQIYAQNASGHRQMFNPPSGSGNSTITGTTSFVAPGNYVAAIMSTIGANTESLFTLINNSTSTGNKGWALGALNNSTGIGLGPTYDTGGQPIYFVNAFYPTGSQNFQGITGFTGVSINPLSTPNSQFVSQGGTAGSTSYTYGIAGVDALGNVGAVNTVSTTTGNATLSGTNYNKINTTGYDTHTLSTGAVSFNIYRTAGGATQGYIGNVAYTHLGGTVTFNDTGLTASGSVPAGDNTGSLYLNTGKTTVTGSASGTVVFSETLTGSSNKKTMIVFKNYCSTNSATFTVPTPYTAIPDWPKMNSGSDAWITAPATNSIVVPATDGATNTGVVEPTGI